MLGSALLNNALASRVSRVSTVRLTVHLAHADYWGIYAGLSNRESLQYTKYAREYSCPSAHR